MPSGIYTRTLTHKNKISNALKGKRKPLIRKTYKKKKIAKHKYDPHTAHGEIINEGKTYEEYIIKENKKNPEMIKNTSLRHSRWVDNKTTTKKK